MGEKQERYPLCNAHRHSLSNSSSCYLTWLQVTNVFKAWFQKMRKTPNQIFNFVDCVSIKKQNTMFSKTRANKTSVVCLCLFIKSFYTTPLFPSLRKKPVGALQKLLNVNKVIILLSSIFYLILFPGKAHLRETLLLHEEAMRINRMCRELRKKDTLQVWSLN